MRYITDLKFFGVKNGIYTHFPLHFL